MYLLDTNIIRTLFNFYYDEELTPEFKRGFETLINRGELISVKEVYNELILQCKKDSELAIWLKDNKSIFLTPEMEEIIYIKDIYAQRNFQNNIAQKNILRGMPVADPFLCAKAKHLNGVIVTKEVYSEHAAKIPNICEYLNVRFIGIREFLLILKSVESSPHKLVTAINF